MRPALWVKGDPCGPASEKRPSEGHRESDVAPTGGAHGVHEFDGQEHRDGEGCDDDQTAPPCGFQREEDEDDHVPATREAFERIVRGLHTRVGEVHRGGESDDDDRDPARPPIHQARGIEREGGDEDVGEVVDDEVEQNAVKSRRVGFHIVLARKRTVDAVNDEGDDEPKEHKAPIALHSGKHREHCENGPCCSEQVDEMGLSGDLHPHYVTVS